MPRTEHSRLSLEGAHIYKVEIHVAGIGHVETVRVAADTERSAQTRAMAVMTADFPNGLHIDYTVEEER